MDEEPPDKKIVLFASLTILLIIGYYLPVNSENLLELRLKREDTILEDRLGLIQENTLLPVVSPVYFEVDILGYRVITAYNSLEQQTDDTPCISASGLNVCETEKEICATNEFPFGTRLLIDGKIICEVQDRTNSRYSYRIDLLMDEYNDAITWGRRTLKIGLIK